MLDKKKAYYSISEVCTKTSLEPHVLRYWESEFAQLRPKKNRAGNRAYRDKDIDIVRYIKYLLYEEQFTIPGAKKKLAEAKEFDLPSQMQLQLGIPAQPSQAAPAQDNRLAREVSEELLAVLRILGR
jgi:DNA-binding transcriptional MerR regulator